MHSRLHAVVAGQARCAWHSVHRLLSTAPRMLSVVILCLQAAVPDVRLGDIYGLLVEWCHQQGNPQQAMQLLQQMVDRGLAPQMYLPEAVIAELCQVLRG